MSLRAVQREYDALAGHYDQRWKGYVAASTALAASRLELTPNEWLLDVGCGTGALLEQLHRRAPSARLIGVDATVGMLLRARARLAPAVLLVESTGEALPLADASVQSVVSTSALHYMEDAPRALREMHRVLAPGGRLVIVDWCADFLTMRALDVALRVFDRAHTQTFTSAAVQRLVAGANFERINVAREKIDRFWGLFVLIARVPS
ncbi:class I SAM-dependent methyltransferase [Gemmatimonas groenlandica]|uniref:Class I SAM-dependent methyltransferase n=1 Tax=Gemmatimonas groenlandica TaxID=2732249 RepID=A0A6M4ING1_9BACT|nr:methyltransferase domain-containing protein [Gemmatimonas groenlandica]QJR35458.1 class I SAM-dependent methyltransferase [Gemmatimonas groenlandica]